MVFCEGFSCWLGGKACAVSAGQARRAAEMLAAGVPEIAIPAEWIGRIRTCGECSMGGFRPGLLGEALNALWREYGDAVKALEIDWERAADGEGENFDRRRKRKRAWQQKRERRERTLA